MCIRDSSRAVRELSARSASNALIWFRSRSFDFTSSSFVTAISANARFSADLEADDFGSGDLQDGRGRVGLVGGMMLKPCSGCSNIYMYRTCNVMKRSLYRYV